MDEQTRLQKLNYLNENLLLNDVAYGLEQYMIPPESIDWTQVPVECVAAYMAEKDAGGNVGLVMHPQLGWFLLVAGQGPLIVWCECDPEELYREYRDFRALGQLSTVYQTTMNHPGFRYVKVQRVNEEEQSFLNLFDAEYETRSGKKGHWQFASRNKSPQLAPHPAAVIIVAIVRSHLLVSSEFRIPIGRREYGFCAGLIEGSETPESAASRELLEESGLTIKRQIYTSPPIVSSAGLSDEAVYMVFVEAEGELSNKGHEADEDIETMLLSCSDILDLCERSGKFSEVTIAAKAWPILFMFSRLIYLGFGLGQIIGIVAGTYK